MVVYLVRGRDPQGFEVDDAVLSLEAAFKAVARFEQRGVMDIRMVEAPGGREIDWRKLRENDEK